MKGMFAGCKNLRYYYMGNYLTWIILKHNYHLEMYYYLLEN
jgi:hypothetical protein